MTVEKNSSFITNLFVVPATPWDSECLLYLSCDISVGWHMLFCMARTACSVPYYNASVSPKTHSSIFFNCHGYWEHNLVKILAKCIHGSVRSSGEVSVGSFVKCSQGLPVTARNSLRDFSGTFPEPLTETFITIYKQDQL